MCNSRIAVIFICWLVMLSVAAGGAGALGTQSSSAQSPSNCNQDDPPTGSAKDFECARFVESTHIDNKWLPLEPGARFVYEGSAIVEGDGRQARRVVSTVTDLTKVIAGVRTLVILENDYTAGRLGETELAFFAQDREGNVWRLGEYPEEYVNGKLDEIPFWIAGLRGARAGIAMPAHPRLGEPSYSQGYAPPPVDFKDRARTYKVGQRTCVPVGCYENVLVTEEFERGVPGAYQLKYYAPHVGNVRVGWRGAQEEERETLKLVDHKRLGPVASAKVLKAAMELDKRARERSKIYRQTAPLLPL